MSKTAFLFPGQGAQSVGMGVALASQSKAAKEVLDAVDDALGGSLSKLMADGPADELTLTKNAQPALFASSLAVVRAIEAELGQPLSKFGDVVAGHSLGEYSALAAVGTLEIEDAAKLLRLRGEAMQEAVPVGQGAMAALLGADLELAEDIVGRASGTVQVANDNATGQIVISGAVEAVEEAMGFAKDAGLRRVVKLDVSAPFHCDLMAPAADKMAVALAGTMMHRPSLPVICNVTAGEETDPQKLRQNLITQVTGRVRWRETLHAMQNAGVNRFIELGTGKVLSGLVKRSLEDVTICNVETLEDLEGLF